MKPMHAHLPKKPPPPIVTRLSRRQTQIRMIRETSAWCLQRPITVLTVFVTTTIIGLII